MIKIIKKYGVELIALLALISAIMNHNRGDYGDQVIIKTDALGYYAYLPAIFIYHDPGFGFKNNYKQDHFMANDNAEYLVKCGNSHVNKYFCGLAVLAMPFFLLAHLIALIFQLPADGYSPIYQWCMIISAVFYLYLGFKALHKLLILLGGSETSVLFVLLVIYFSTNLFHYSTREPAMSHVYSFSLSCIFALALYKLCYQPKGKWLILCLLPFGFIIAIRPVNLIMIGMFPIMAGSIEKMKEAIIYAFKNLKYLFIGIFLFCFPLLIQMLLWHWQTGHFIVYSYGEEGFNWSKPEIINILFSYRKGWFVYTPIALIGLVGLVLYWPKDKFRVGAAMLYMCLVIYVLSCWWNWWYGSSFGMRAFIDFLLVPALGLTFLLKSAKNIFLKAGLITLFSAAIILNQVQDLQYRHYILRWDNMDKASYWKVFLKISAKYNGMIWK